MRSAKDPPEGVAGLPNSRRKEVGRMEKKMSNTLEKDNRKK
jgi:hypothetical protein